VRNAKKRLVHPQEFTVSGVLVFQQGKWVGELAGNDIMFSRASKSLIHFFDKKTYVSNSTVHC
jgi:hypothetical protein